MTPSFTILSLLTIAGAVLAMSLRNLVHCALALVLTFTGLAAVYLQLDAQFVGFAQILIYVGAVAILIVFAILLTSRVEQSQASILSPTWISGMFVAAAVLGLLVWAVNNSAVMRPFSTPPQPQTTVKDIGDALMTRFVLPLELSGLLLTVALIGAVIIASHESRNQSPKTGAETAPKTEPIGRNAHE